MVRVVVSSSRPSDAIRVVGRVHIVRDSRPYKEKREDRIRTDSAIGVVMLGLVCMVTVRGEKGRGGQRFPAKNKNEFPPGRVF